MGYKQEFSKKSTFKSPKIRNLLEISDTLSSDHENVSQKDLSLFGGRYIQQRKKLQVGSHNSNQIHSIDEDSRSIRREALIVEGTQIRIPPPCEFLSLRKMVP